jgi:hypothetical protein
MARDTGAGMAVQALRRIFAEKSLDNGLKLVDDRISADYRKRPCCD